MHDKQEKFMQVGKIEQLTTEKTSLDGLFRSTFAAKIDTDIKEIKDLIKLAMLELSEMSCGGIGAEGYTLEELDSFLAEYRAPIEGNNDFHQAQTVWRILERVLEKIG